MVVGVHVEQLPAPPLVRYGLKLLPFRLDRLLGVLELVDLPQGRDLVAEEALLTEGHPQDASGGRNRRAAIGPPESMMPV